MMYYEVSGADSGHDCGAWTIIVQAANQRQAEKVAKKYLRDVCRPDLQDGLKCRLLSPSTDGVIYADVDTTRGL